jgi:hypothetical protein
MTVETSIRAGLQDIKTVIVECRLCGKNRRYSHEEIAARKVSDFPPSQCSCSEPTKLFLALLGAQFRAEHWEPEFKILVEFPAPSEKL